MLGTKAALADLLGVDRSRVSRWEHGDETPRPNTARYVLDLDHLVARARLVLHESVIKTWLTSSNAFLNNATPMDALRTDHADEAIRALEGFDEGAYA